MSKAHYIEVFLDSEQEDDGELEFGGGDSEDLVGRGPPPPLPQGGPSFTPTRGVLASLCGIPKFLTMSIRGMV